MVVGHNGRVGRNAPCLGKMAHSAELVFVTAPSHNIMDLIVLAP